MGLKCSEGNVSQLWYCCNERLHCRHLRAPACALDARSRPSRAAVRGRRRKHKR